MTDARANDRLRRRMEMYMNQPLARTLRKIASAIGINYTTLSVWLHGGRDYRDANLRKIQQFLEEVE